MSKNYQNGRIVSPSSRCRSDRSRSIYKLGPLPWSEEVLRKAYYKDFIETRKAIQEHPGFLAHRDLSDLGLSLDIFVDSVSDLIDSIEAFRIESRSSEFWTRPARVRFDKRELAIRRGVFAAATSAIALVEHSRKINDRGSMPVYQQRVNETFANNEMHRFIQSFRNCINHQRIIEADWRKNWSITGDRTQFLLKQDILLNYSNWYPLAKAFIGQHPDGIDVEALFEKYRTRVVEFHNWFHGEVKRVSEPDLSEYQKYERILNRFDANAWWNLMLKQAVIGRGLDPYKYLDRYLTKPELDEVLSLPMRSQNQVDRIIEILDEYGACDDELRGAAYVAFGVNVQGS